MLPSFDAYEYRIKHQRECYGSSKRRSRRRPRPGIIHVATTLLVLTLPPSSYWIADALVETQPYHAASAPCYLRIHKQRFLWSTTSTALRAKSSTAHSATSEYNGRQNVRSQHQQQRREKDNHQVRQLYQKARDLERKGQWRKAAELLRDIVDDICPTDAHSYLALAKLEARRFPQQCSIARSLFERGTTACPDSIHLWQAWAVYEESHGNLARAQALLQTAVARAPNNAYVCHAYGLLEYKAGHVTQARALWERALQASSTAALVCSLGELLIGEHEYAAARDLYGRHVTRLSNHREKTEVYLAAAWLEERYFGNDARATALLQRSLTLNPSSSLAHVALARLEGRRRQKQSGETLVTATRRRLANACNGVENQNTNSSGSSGAFPSSPQVPEDGRMYTAWATFEVKSHRLQAARTILAKGRTRYPRDFALFQAAGKVEERLGNVTGARELYSASLQIQPSAPALVAYALLELRQQRLSGKIDYARVRGLFEEALLIDPRHGPAYNSFGNMELRRGNVENARNVFVRGINANCADAASVFHGYAQLELSLGNVAAARDLLVRGRQAAHRQNLGRDSPHRERALFLTHTLGMIELSSNNAAQALEVFQDGMERYGNSSQLLLGAALSESKLGNEDKARILFERSVTADARHAQAWQAWGVMEMRAGHWQVAKRLFELGIKSAPYHGALWLAYAVAEGRLGNYHRARALFAKGIQSAPRHVPLYQAWASLELREGNLASARTLISEALTKDKTNGSGWLVAAEIETQSGSRTGLNVLLLRRGIECAPNHAALYRALGCALERQNKFDEARIAFEEGIEVDPLHAPLYHSLAELEARIFNVEGLSKLNKRAAEVFTRNAMEPPIRSCAAWGTKIRARRSKNLPKAIVSLAQRIGSEDEAERTDEGCNLTDGVDPNALIDMLSANVMDDSLVGQWLLVSDDGLGRNTTEQAYYET